MYNDINPALPSSLAHMCSLENDIDAFEEASFDRDISYVDVVLSDDVDRLYDAMEANDELANINDDLDEVCNEDFYNDDMNDIDTEELGDQYYNYDDESEGEY